MTRKMTTLLGTLQQINESVQGLNQGNEGGGATYQQIQKVIENTIYDYEDKNDCTKSTLSAWASKLLDAFECKNVKINIDIIIIGWLLFNFYSSLKVNPDKNQWRGLAIAFEGDVLANDSTELLNKELAAIIQDADGLATVMNAVNTGLPMFQNAFAEILRQQPSVNKISKAKKPDGK